MATTLWLAIAGGTVAAQEPRPLRVGIHDARPVAFLDAAGRPRGFVVELLEHVAAIEGWRLEWVAGTPGENMERARQREIDVVFPVTGPHAPYKANVGTEPFLATWGRLFAPEGHAIASVLDLRGRTVAVVAGDVFGSEIARLCREFEVAMTVLERPDAAAAFAAAAEGRADAVAVERIDGHGRAAAHGCTTTPIVFMPVSGFFATAPDGRPDVIDALDRHLRTLKAESGSAYHRAYERWIGADTARGGLPGWAAVVLILALGGLGMAAGFTVLLRARVRARTRELAARNAALEAEARARARAEAERGALESQLRHAQRLEALGTLAAGVAHDFNNMLGVILAYTEVAADAAEDPAQVRLAMAEATQAVERATRLTRSLLTFARQDGADRAPFDLADVVTEAAELLRRMLPARIAIDCEVEPGLAAVVHGSRDQVLQALLNLGVNARDVMPEGGRLAIAARSVTGGTGPAVEVVADTGPGVPLSLRARVFEPFFTTKPRGSGTGLGLAIVHGVVGAHGGTVRLDDRSGGGARFTVTLPVVASQAPDATPAGPAPATPTPAGLPLLLVDDNSDLRAVMRRALAEAGWAVTESGDGAEALARFRVDPARWAVLVVDLDLPGMDGGELLRRARALRHDVPAIIVTGLPDPSVPRPPGPPIEVLTKPFQLDDLRAAVAAAAAAGNPAA